MSDGHFNRSFLPHGDFASGVRVGRASERGLCLRVLADMLQKWFPHLTEEERAAACLEFKRELTKREPMNP